MAIISATSRIKYYDVQKTEINFIITTARVLFNKAMKGTVKGTFEDKRGEIAFLTDFHVVDMERVGILKKFLPVVIDGKTDMLLIPEVIDELLIESTI